MAASVDRAIVSVRSIIESHLRRIAVEHGRRLEPLTDELKLLESGLDSLSLAVLVMHLADTLGVDPLNCGKSIEFPATLGEFIRIYETSLPEATG